MIENWVFISVALFGAFAGTFTDLKARWSPDWVSYFMVIFGLGGHVMVSILQNSFWPILYSSIGFAAMFGVAALMFYTGVHGGGDAKLLMGFGALLPTAPEFVIEAAPWPFFMTNLFNIMAVTAIFGLLAAFYLAVRYHKKVGEDFRREISKNKFTIYYVSFAMIFIPIIAVYTNYNIILWVGILAYLCLILIFALRAVENTCMFKYTEPSKLVEGDWVAEPINIDGYSFKPKKTGIGKQDIEMLRKLEEQGRLQKVKIKEGFPIIPAYLLALVVSITYGDLIFSLIMRLM